MNALLKLTALIVVLFIASDLTAQSKLKGELKGQIVAPNTQEPLEFATVSIFAKSDGTLVQGDVSDVTGSFTIGLDQNTYYVEISFVGLSTLTIDDITISDISPSIDLGQITLMQGSIELDDIEIVGEKSQLTFDLDKKVFNVGKDIASSSTNALDVLDQVPSVSVDPNGNINIRGSAGITILIDGKPSVLASAQQLQKMLPERLDKIEVITNPSAKYDAAGIAGILNIILKKNEDSGVAGSASLRAGYPHDYSLGLGLSRRKNKFNVFGDVSLRHWRRPRTTNRSTEYSASDNNFYNEQFSEQIRRSYSVEADAGFDYSFNDKNILTTSLVYEGGRQPHDATLEYLNYSRDRQLLSSQIRLNDELEFESSLEYLLNFERNYNIEGKKLKAFVKYTNNVEDNTSNISQVTFDENFIPVASANLEQRTSVDEKDRNFVVQLDYEQPFSKDGTLEMGVKSSLRDIGNNFNVEQVETGEWKQLGGLSNNFSYEEKIVSGYLVGANKVGQLSYQVGLRGEMTDLKTKLEQTNEENNRKPFFNIFPSGHLAYESSNGHELQLSYSRRIDRPRFYHLNPFFSFTDDRFISVGNADLNPMFTDSYELSHIKSWDEFSVHSSVYHRSTQDNIEDVAVVDELGVTYIQPQNLNSERTSGIELSVESSPKKWLRLNAGIEGRNVQLDGLEITRNFNNWSGNISSRFRLPKKTNAQLRFFYVGSSQGIQGTVSSRSRLDFSINKQLIDGKARVSFSVMDILQSFQYKYEQTTAKSNSIVLERPWRRTFSLAFLYRW